MMLNVALFASMISILAQITIPLPLIPITGQTLAIGLAVTILGSTYGSYAVILYCLMGAIGLPVFTNFHSGLTALTGPTGGFIIGFIPCAIITGIILEKTAFRITNAFIANIIGMIITLIFGTIWLKYFANLSWTSALSSGFYPFIIVGLLKAYLAAVIGITVRNRLIRAKLLPFPAKRAS
ncbi:biotin transporter BioY [Caldibacillus lycopersici]|uniref:Biotin transporter n=1 Tax=Perspicuibacillus lycopersici TaxID=1325689 RepID=A0AAE3LT75_9BACI|nr:biotin transporter BioY [Perspicuibacillus lycopersici]MCU9613588.1 biotin transporter BioY [Perspicuibacillus lycopersici]